MKIFAVSDIHSFFTEFKQALDEKGFEDNNPDHLLVICGDVFDRGPESVAMYHYLNNLSNVVLVRGNHEDLLKEMLIRGYGERHDVSNGTVQTATHLLELLDFVPDNNYEMCKEVDKLITPFLDKYVNYFETKNYIFVHGWIPCDTWENTDRPWYQRNRTFKYDPNWRDANDVEWYSARWINGMNAGYTSTPKVLEPGKTIVCGHWHCSWGHHIKSIKTDNWISEFEEDAIWEPFEEEGILAIDGCTAYTHKVNVVVLEDELLEETKE